MTYNLHHYDTLHRLGIEQLPPLRVHANPFDLGDPFKGAFPVGDLPLRTMPVPGKKCPACAAKNVIVWVIPGKRCPQCGTQVN